MKKCPFCAEEIQDEAVKCRFCNEFLNAKKKAPWYFNSGLLVLLFFGMGPFMLPLVWVHPTYTRIQKILITVVLGVISWFLLQATIDAWQSLQKYYGLFSGKICTF